MARGELPARGELVARMSHLGNFRDPQTRQREVVTRREVVARGDAL